MVPDLITSAQNPKVKRLLALQKDSSLRRESGLFVVEGRRELERCIASGYKVDSLFICPEIASNVIPGTPSVIPGLIRNPNPSSAIPGTPSVIPGLIRNPNPSSAISGSPLVISSGGAAVVEKSPIKTFYVSTAVYDRIAYRGGTEGIIAEVFAKELSLADLQLPADPLIVVLESVEKPGNLGAVLRSADAAGASAVLVCDPLTDLYNPNLVRASLGTCFSVPTVACTSAEAISWLQSLGIQILTAQLQDSSLYYDCDMRRGTAIIMGTESTGLSDDWRRAASAHIRIPMLGIADSLNVSVSAAILLYEAVRQRH